jgi:hypothetical protein
LQIEKIGPSTKEFNQVNFSTALRMANREDYNQQRNQQRSSKRDINFSDRDYDNRGGNMRQFDDEAFAGRNDYDYDDRRDYYPEDDRDYYPEDNQGDDYYPEDDRNYYPEDNQGDDYYPEDDRSNYYPQDDEPQQGYYPRRPQQRQQQQQQPRQPQAQQRQPRQDDQDGYRQGYRDGFRDNNQPHNPNSSFGNNMNNTDQKPNFRKRHPILMNLIYAALATVLVLYISLWFLDFWTFHGQERAVPDVKGQSFNVAESNIERAGLRCVVTDSIYDTYARPGTVVEQIPIPSARIKKGGTVYLTLVAYSPKMVTFPDFYDISERQARSMLQGLGITQIMTVTVPSEYTGLVLGAKFNGVSLRPGAKVPITAVITLEVGGTIEDLSSTNELVDTAAIEEAIEASEALNID